MKLLERPEPLAETPPEEAPEAHSKSLWKTVRELPLQAAAWWSSLPKKTRRGVLITVAVAIVIFVPVACDDPGPPGGGGWKR